MEKENKKQLSDLWGKQHIQFHHFEFVTQDQPEKIINDTPRKYKKKQVGSSFLRIKLEETLGVIVLPKVERVIANKVLSQMCGPKYYDTNAVITKGQRQSMKLLMPSTAEQQIG